MNTTHPIQIAFRNAGHIHPNSLDDYTKQGGFIGLKKALQQTPEEVIAWITRSGLRGRGGAGFPTGSKWNYARSAPHTPKFVICNADEGEPGTFKDRVLMEEDPFSCLEGLLIAAYALGASKGYFYIRGEYHLSIQRIQQAILIARSQGLLGQSILGSDFSCDIQVRLGAGSYLCGEESALIESLEGKRGFPRIKPPYPAEKGVFLKPTVVNNVETLCHVPEILRHGADWYRSIGTPKSPGTKIFTLCGDVCRPGCIEAPMGTTLRELIYEGAGGITCHKTLKAVLCGGAAGTFMPPEYLDIAMDYDSLKEKGFLLGSGALILLHQDRSLRDFLQDVLRFFHHESCGKCVPCRIGSKHLLDAMKKIPPPLNELLELAEMMAKTSLCPLGQSPIFPLRSAITHFKTELLSASDRRTP